MKTITTFILGLMLAASSFGATASSLKYLPRQDSQDGRLKGYKVESSDDSLTWNTLASGTFVDGIDEKTITFTKTTARYFRLVGTSSQNGSLNAAVAEINLFDDSSIVPRSGWVVSADSENTAVSQMWGPSLHAIDGNVSTFWLTKWPTDQTQYPHTFTIDTGGSTPIFVPDKVNLEWNANPETDIKNYVIQYVGPDAVPKFQTATTSSYTFTNLGVGTWTFSVKAVSNMDLEGPYSDSVTAVITGEPVPSVPPAKVTGLRATIVK